VLRKRLSIALLALYALVLCVGPILHHDFVCHLKTPAHCEACTASPAAAPPEPGPAILAALLPPAETVSGAPTLAPCRTTTPLLPGRAPPA
jgi:hypothetical protein